MQKMKFKEGDIVRLKHPSEEDKQNAKLNIMIILKNMKG